MGESYVNRKKKVDTTKGKRERYMSIREVSGKNPGASGGRPSRNAGDPSGNGGRDRLLKKRTAMLTSSEGKQDAPRTRNRLRRKPEVNP